MQSGAVDDSVIVVNSTISNNFSANSYAGAFVAAPLTMQSSTVAYNFAVASCGGVQGASDVAIESNIIAGNYSGNAGCVDLRSNGTISGSHNLLSVATTGLPADTNIATPRLTPLADHGGPTRTHAFREQPGIDHGSNVGALATDQRGAGFGRVVARRPTSVRSSGKLMMTSCSTGDRDLSSRNLITSHRQKTGKIHFPKQGQSEAP